MELASIEKLLEAYFEGNTTLAEETTLGAYFAGKRVAPHLQNYQPLFSGLEAARKEVFHKEIVVPKNMFFAKTVWWYGIAASAAVAIIIASFMFSQPSISKEEKEALIALNESKKAMLFLSENLNKGVEQLALVNQFIETKNRILK